jgi:RNA polymerase sigma-70 factor, ECF subfamily
MTRTALDELKERQLIDRVAAGDSTAMRLLFDRHAPAMHRLAVRLLASRDDADDAVQDVFVGLRTALLRYTHQGSLEAWLLRLTVRVALMRLRGDRRRQATAVRDIEHASPDAALPDPPLAAALDRAVAALPDHLRAVVVLRMIEDYSHEEIAQALGISAGASKVRLHRALELLRPQLSHLREVHQ